MTDLQKLIDNCANAYGKAYIPSGASIIGNTRSSLCALAAYLGVTRSWERNDADLISLYAVARKSPDAARRIAARLEGKEAPQPAPSGYDPQLAREVEQLREKLEEAQLRTDRLECDLAEEVHLRLDAQAALDAALKALEPDSEALAGMVRDAVAAAQPTRLIVELPERPKVALGLTHCLTPLLIQWLTGRPDYGVYLHGPAGTGKTSAAKQVATAFGLHFYFAARVESEYMLFGFRDANGHTVRTPFREAYEHGGVFLFDEMDSSASSAIVALNAALANGVASFPDGVIPMHPDFKCIGAGNTVLTGGSHQYTGRVALDAASVDRFVFLEFGYDEELERALCTNSAWCTHVQAIRAIVAERGLDHLVTPRASIFGAQLMDRGATWRDAENAAIFKGLDADTVAQIRAATHNPFLSNAA